MNEESSNAESVVRSICADHAGRESPLLPILQEIQARLGYLSNKTVRVVADELNVTRAEVFGVVSFYHDFKRSPQAAHTLKVCRAEACQAVGGRELWATASAHAERGKVSVAVEPVYCLGNCACGPSVQFDGHTMGHMDAERVSTLLATAVSETAQ